MAKRIKRPQCDLKAGDDVLVNELCFVPEWRGRLGHVLAIGEWLPRHGYPIRLRLEGFPESKTLARESLTKCG